MTEYTTLNELRKHDPCPDGWQNLLKHLGKTKADNEPLFYASILESNGLQDAIWALRTYPNLQQVVLFAADCAESVLHIYESKHPDDDRPRKAIEAVRNSANDAARSAARNAAYDAADAADAAYAASYAASYADDAYDDAYDDAIYAAHAAHAAPDAHAEREKQEQIYLKYFGGGQKENTNDQL